MPIYRLVRQELVLTPDEISSITIAFEDALRSMGLVNRADPLAETVATKVIELVKAGERDPERLRRQVLIAFGQTDRGQTDRKAC
jgi:hypothetical protein